MKPIETRFWKKFRWLFILLCLLLPLVPAQSQTYDPSDSLALLAIDACCDGNNTVNWNTEPNPTYWEGVHWTNGVMRKVKELYLEEKSLSGTFDVSNLAELTSLDCSYNLLTNINISNINKLNSLYCASNLLDTLNLSSLDDLKVLDCSSNKLSNINLSSLDDLKELYCSVNKISNINLLRQDSLRILDCDHNLLTTIDLTPSQNLYVVTCNGNQLSSIKLTGLINLQILECENNHLRTLNVSYLSNLLLLYCGWNLLDSINLSACAAVTRLFCYSNLLTHINVTDLVNLIDFQCYENQITELDVSHCFNLEYLYCFINKLTSIDVSMLPNLKVLQCSYNNLTFSDLDLDIDKFDFIPQNIISQPLTLNENTTIDYSSEAMIETTPTQFVFYKDGDKTETNTTGLFTTIGSGEYHCKMTNGLFPGLTLTTATITIEGANGVDENESSFSAIYPNPVNDRVFFTNPGGIEQVSVYSLTGTELIKTTNISAGIDLSRLSIGTYLIRATGNGRQYLQRIVVN